MLIDYQRKPKSSGPEFTSTYKEIQQGLKNVDRDFTSQSELRSGFAKKEKHSLRAFTH